MHGKSDTKIFIASSWELREDRRAFRELILEQNNAWHQQGVFLRVIGWEYFLDAVSPTRLQDEYNEKIRECDVFVMLYHTKVGKFTREEFETALEQFHKTSKPLIYTYFKSSSVTHAPSDNDKQSLIDFEQRLHDLGHFKTSYENTQGLLLHFLQQLYRLADIGNISFAPPGGAPAKGESPPPFTNIQACDSATVEVGSGAKVVDVGGMLVGPGGAGTYNAGTQNTGTIVHGGYFPALVHQGSGDVVGRDKVGWKSSGGGEDD